MVRVICVHHFTRQDVASLDDSGSCCTAGPADLLLVGGEHRINIRDLGNEVAPAGGFPTVDQVQQIVYCHSGNFVVTLETKPARSGFSDHTYVRVYLNWDKQVSPRPSTDQSSSFDIRHHGGSNRRDNLQDSCDERSASSKDPECSASPPMRARIAGRVTPSGQAATSDTLEMVEIPLKKPASFVNVCQASGNLIVVSGMSLSIFKFEKKQLETSRLEYIDFDEILEIDVGFYVREAALLEDLVGCVSDREAHVFQVVTNQACQRKISKGNSVSNESNKLEGTASVLKDTGTWNISSHLSNLRNRSNADDMERRHVQSRSSSRSKSRSRSISRSPGRASKSRGDSRLRPNKRNASCKEDGSGCGSFPCEVRVADSCLDLSTAQWSDMMPYGTPALAGAVQQSLPGGHRLVLLPSLLQPQAVTSSAASADQGVGSDASTGEHIGPTKSNHVSPVRVKLVSGSGQRVITGVFHAVTLIHRRVDLPYPAHQPPSPPHSTTSSADGSAITSPSLPAAGFSCHGGEFGSSSLGGGGHPSWRARGGGGGSSRQQLSAHVPFSNLKLVPLTSYNLKGPIIRSSAHPLLLTSPRQQPVQQPQHGPSASPPPRASVEVFFSSPLTGFLYHLNVEDDPFASSVQRGCLFSYTSPASCVMLEPSLLHALTLTGLETYTLPSHPRVLAAVLPPHVQIKVPAQWQSGAGGGAGAAAVTGGDVTSTNGGGGLGGCLVGLRPFLNVHSLALTQSCLALIASPGDTPRGQGPSTATEDTVYSLHRPTAASLYGEMVRVGRTHLPSAPSTYRHLLLEALLVLVVHQYWRGMEATEGADTVEGDGVEEGGLGGSLNIIASGLGSGIEECMKLKMAGKRLEEMESGKHVLLPDTGSSSGSSSPRDIGKSKSMSDIEDNKSPGRKNATSSNRNRSKERKKKDYEKKNGKGEGKSLDKIKMDLFFEEPEEEGTDGDVWALIKEAVMLLADYYAIHGSELDWQWSLVNSYLGFRVSLATVVSRLTSLRDRRADAALLHALCNLLTDPRQPPLPYAEASVVLDCLERLAPDRVAEALLRSHCLLDYRKDKVLGVLKQELSKHSPPRPTDVLALATVVLDRGSPEQVSSVFGLLRPHQLLATLLRHPALLLRATAGAFPPSCDSAPSSMGGGGSPASSSCPVTPRPTAPDLLLTPLSLILMDYKWDIFCDIFMSLINTNITTSTNNGGSGANNTIDSPKSSQSNTSHSVTTMLTLDGFCLAIMEARPIVTCGPECNVNSLRLRDFLEAYFMEYAYTIVQAQGGDATRNIEREEEGSSRVYERSVSVLVSLYLASLLGAFTAKSREEVVKEEQRHCMEEVYGPRPAFLNMLPPFSEGGCSSDQPLPHGQVMVRTPRSEEGETSSSGSSPRGVGGGLPLPGEESLESSSKKETGVSRSKHQSVKAGQSDGLPPSSAASAKSKAVKASSSVSSTPSASTAPVSPTSNSSVSSSGSSGGGGVGGHKACVDLLILQSLLCSPLPSPSDRQTVARFVSSNPSIAGSDGILAACLTGDRRQQAVLLMSRHPHAFTTWARDSCNSAADWLQVTTLLANQLRGKSTARGDEKVRRAAELLQEILWDLSSSLPFNEFISVLPFVDSIESMCKGATSSRMVGSDHLESSRMTPSNGSAEFASDHWVDQYSELIKQSHSAALAQHLTTTIHAYADTVLLAKT